MTPGKCEHLSLNLQNPKPDDIAFMPILFIPVSPELLWEGKRTEAGEAQCLTGQLETAEKVRKTLS